MGQHQDGPAASDTLKQGVDTSEIVCRLQRNGAKPFAGAWNELMDPIEAQVSVVT